MIEGTKGIKEHRSEYDFAVDGGGVGTITLRSNDSSIPNGSVILGGYVTVETALDSGGSATAALQSNAANDIINAAAFGGAPWSTTGQKSVIPVHTGATSIVLTAARDPKLVIGTAALTAGKFKLVLFFR